MVVEPQYEFELEKVLDTICAKGFKKVLLQFPEGLKKYATDVAAFLEQHCDAVISIYGGTTYGACDVPVLKNVDLIVHFGHFRIPNVEYPTPVFFVPAYSKVAVENVVRKAISKLDGSVGLITTAQHLDSLKKVQDILKEAGIKSYVGSASKRVAKNGLVLGCNFSTALSAAKKVAEFLYIGSGNFHPLGVAINTNKRVVIADPYLNEVRDVESLKSKILQQRYAAIEACEKMRKTGIIVSMKTGQTRYALALELRHLLAKHNIKSKLIFLDFIEPYAVLQFELDAYVCTGCPRIAIDDYLKFKAPIITPVELEVVLGKRKWTEYKLDEIT